MSLTTCDVCGGTFFVMQLFTNLFNSLTLFMSQSQECQVNIKNEGKIINFYTCTSRFQTQLENFLNSMVNTKLESRLAFSKAFLVSSFDVKSCWWDFYEACWTISHVQCQDWHSCCRYILSILLLLITLIRLDTNWNLFHHEKTSASWLMMNLKWKPTYNIQRLAKFTITNS